MNEADMEFYSIKGGNPLCGEVDIALRGHYDK